MNNPARIASQAEHCAKAVANVLVDTLIKRKPADEIAVIPILASGVGSGS